MLRCSDSKELESGWSPLGFGLVGWCLGDQGRSTWSETGWSEDLIKKQLTFVQMIVLKCLLRHDGSIREPSWFICAWLASPASHPHEFPELWTQGLLPEFRGQELRSLISLVLVTWPVSLWLAYIQSAW